MKTLALFDFDGTLTTRDSFILFMLHLGGVRGTLRWLRSSFGKDALRSSWRRDVEPLKLGWMKDVLAGRSRAEYEASGRRFCAERLPALLRRDAIARLDWHRAQGHEVWIVSASLDAWLRPWCDARGIGLMCTELESEEGILTGRLSGPHCDGENKARLVRERLDLTRFDRVFAYGNGSGDRAMLALAR